MASEESKIDKKLDYVLVTKLLIRQALTNKGAIVTDDTTFRSYADLVNNIEVAQDQSDATVTSNDLVAGKIAYNNNNRVIGSLTEYTVLNSDAAYVTEDINNEKIIATTTTDVRTLLKQNANINMSIPYTSIDDYQDCLEIADDILDI